MNIFATSSSPSESAVWLDDLRKNKMILESAQMLSTAMRILETSTDWPVYKAAYVNHPCTVWTRQSLGNFQWLLDHMICLSDNREHKSKRLIPTFKFFLESSTKFPEIKLTPFCNCTTYKEEEDVHQAYQMYLIDKWNSDKRQPTWNYGKKPEWYNA